MRKFLLAALMLGILLLITPVSSCAIGYIAHALSSWGNDAFAYDINDLGQIVGSGSFGGVQCSVLWNSMASEPQALCTGNYAAEAYINNSGRVVLRQFDTNGSYMFTWSATIGLNRLSNPDHSSIEAIDANGIIVGNEWGSEGTTQAFLLSETGNISYINNVFGGVSIRAAGINDTDCVVGIASTPSGQSRAYIWHDGNTADLGTFGGTWSEGRAINNSGQVVGVYGGDNGYTGWFCWSNDSEPVLITDNSLFDMHEVFIPLAINDNGLVVGNALINRENTIATWSLNDGFSIVGTGEAYAINNSGYIVGINDGQAMIWQPVPEPSTFVALAFGLVGILSRTRKRRSS